MANSWLEWLELLVFNFFSSIKRKRLKIMRADVGTWEILCKIVLKITLTPILSNIEIQFF